MNEVEHPRGADNGSEAGTDETDSTSEIESKNDRDYEDTAKYKVLPNYDAGFLKKGEVTTVTKLLETREETNTQNLTMQSFGSAKKKRDVGTNFIFALILRITVPSNKSGEAAFPLFKKNKFDKKATTRAAYKKCILVADLADPNQLTGVILEESNEDHNRLFQRDISLDNVSVGSKCAIMNPRIEGHQLKNGAWVITTNRPLEFLQAPTLPRRPLRSERVGHELRYYIIKGAKVMLLDDDNIDPLKTKCNFHSCDRHNANGLGNQTCGCWVQNRRNDNGPKNTVMMFSFYFQDSSGKIVKVQDFTSLRTSKLFFKGKSILSDADTLNTNAVYDYVQDQWRSVIDHVNSNGGWTIVGWYIRATVEEDDKDENDETLLRTNVKINVSYLYPSSKTVQFIPNEHTIDNNEVKKLATPAAGVTSDDADEYAY
jgi:hypothetical protein